MKDYVSNYDPREWLRAMTELEDEVNHEPKDSVAFPVRERSHNGSPREAGSEHGESPLLVGAWLTATSA